MPKERLKTHSQKDRHTSAFSFRQRAARWSWYYLWSLLCEWTPPPLNDWRLFWLKLFGCTIEGRPFVHPRARIDLPWNLILKDRSTLGDRAHAYTLDVITIEENATVAQEVYLCSGTHKMDEQSLPLQTAPIRIGKNSFIGARAFIMPGVVIGEGAIVGACSVVSSDIPDWTVWAGNPAKFLKTREYDKSP